jgi:hypothetical protein
MKWISLLFLLMLAHVGRAEMAPSIPERCVQHYAIQYHVPPELIAALIDVESRWNGVFAANQDAPLGTL